MPNLTKKEKDQLFELSRNFIKIHSEINYVEETIKKMERFPSGSSIALGKVRRS